MVGKRQNLQLKPLFLAATEMAVLDESVVISGAGYALVWGSEDISYMGRGLRCCMTLGWELLERFGVAIIVDIISLLQPPESQSICTWISSFLTRESRIEENRFNHCIIFHLQATAWAQLNNDQFSSILIIKINNSFLNQQL